MYSVLGDNGPNGLICELGNYNRLANLAKEEGTRIMTYEKNGSPSLKKCQDKCDKTYGCKSIGFCPRYGCYLYDKQITVDEPQRVNADCYTSFRPCTGIQSC